MELGHPCRRSSLCVVGAGTEEPAPETRKGLPGGGWLGPAKRGAVGLGVWGLGSAAVLRAGGTLRGWHPGRVGLNAFQPGPSADWVVRSPQGRIAVPSSCQGTGHSEGRAAAGGGEALGGRGAGGGKAGEHSCCLFLEHLLGARHCAKSITRAITPAGFSTPPLRCDPKRSSNCPTSHA